MITFNQRRYVEQAVESVLFQEAAFDFELVVGDDASTDGTAELLQSYVDCAPGRIRLLPAERNLGMNHNLARTVSACRGDYVALLEGDDYWLVPDKLERQVRFLDDHPECSICCHDVVTVTEDGRERDAAARHPAIEPISDLSDLLKRNFIVTCTVMFRARLFGEFPDWFFEVPYGDFPLNVLNAQHGRIAYLNEVMAAYRVHAAGAWSRLSPLQQLERRIACLDVLQQHLEPRYEPVLRNVLSTLHYRLGLQHAWRHDWSAGRRHALRAIRLAPLNRSMSLRRLFFLLRKPLTARLRKVLPFTRAT